MSLPFAQLEAQLMLLSRSGSGSGSGMGRKAGVKQADVSVQEAKVAKRE